MTGLDLILALAGLGVTVLVVAGMILITPSGAVMVPTDGADADGSDLSPTGPPDKFDRGGTRP